MADWKNSESVSSVALQMLKAEYFRGKDRSLINRLFNGSPPYTPQEAEDNNLEINVNSLEACVLGHDSRLQFAQGFEKPGNFFTATTDAGPIHKTHARSVTVTKQLNKILKKSLPYYECRRSKFAGLILHGIGPVVWSKADRWRPAAIGIEDLLIPSGIDLTFDGLPFFVILRDYTAPQLIRLDQSSKLDPCWNRPLLKSLLKWIDQESMALIGSNFPDIWSPEKIEERLKSDGSFYAGDQVPKVNVFDFWYYSDEGKHAGWRRRMVINDWSASYTGVRPATTWTRDGDLSFSKGQWLYDGGDRVFADSTEQIFACQFADLSAVPPFRYHSVRSLGYLMYAICHLQNRLRCAFSAAVFENLLMYFRTKNPDDAQQALTVNLVNRGFIPPSVEFLPPQERWQPNHQLSELGLQENARLIARHASSFSSSLVNQAADKREKTKFEVMSELTATNQLVSAALQQAYQYQTVEYREIFRRFCKPDPTDPDVMSFQAECQKRDVPKYMVNDPALWEIEAERIMGGGNKALELAISQQLLEMRNLYDPEPQRQILRDVTLAITDDPARAEALVPEVPQVSDSIHDAQLRWGSLMQGGDVKNKSGVNHIDVIEALLDNLQMAVQRITQMGGVPSGTSELFGLANVSQHIAQEIQLLAGDEKEKQRVKFYGERLSKLNNEIRAFGQRLQEKMQKQNGQAQVDPEAQAKVQAMIMQAEAKAQNTRDSHAQRTAQRQIQWELEQQRKAKEHGQDLRQTTQEHTQDLIQSGQQHAQDLAANQIMQGQDIAAAKLKAKAQAESKHSE